MCRQLVHSAHDDEDVWISDTDLLTDAVRQQTAAFLHTDPAFKKIVEQELAQRKPDISDKCECVFSSDTPHTPMRLPMHAWPQCSALLRQQSCRHPRCKASMCTIACTPVRLGRSSTDSSTPLRWSG